MTKASTLSDHRAEFLAHVVGYMEEVAERVHGTTGRPLLERPRSRLTPVVTHLETANLHKHGGSVVPGRTRFSWFKRMVLRVARLHTSQQAGFNHAALAALHSLDYNVNTLRLEADDRLVRLEAAFVDVDHLLRQLAGQLDRLHGRIVRLEHTAVEQGQARTVDRARIGLLLEETRQRLPQSLEQEAVERLTSDTNEYLAPLYAQLEEEFRGSREQILELQEEYLHDILQIEGDAPVVDIGCGRGEWLELLADHGVLAYGVDTNRTFVNRNRERGLDVRHGDAIEHLLSVEPESVKAVTAFHIIEHVEFADAVRLVDAALVALQPGGLLVLETPNPTNLTVGASLFYLDPTHRNPLHPSFLRFLVEARGFLDVEVRFLHPSKDPSFPLPDDAARRSPTEKLNWALFGPQDYAVIGRKVGLAA